MVNIFCFGYGQVAGNFINELSKKNKINLSYTSRSPKNINNTHNIFELNENHFDSKIVEKIHEADFILISIPPINGEDIVFKHFKSELKKIKAKWITYLSATSVYGDHNGDWVNEKSLTKPTSENGISRLAAEKKWISIYKESNLPIQIFRLSGIYSNSNNILKRLKNGSAKIIDKKNHFFSRIHLDDITNILVESMVNFKGGEIFNISDDRPASTEEITTFAAELLKIKIPEKITPDKLQEGMLKNFYRDSKKVNNDKMKKFFKYKLKFPSFVEGLKFIKDKNF